MPSSYLGAGVAPAGSSPAGYGVPATADSPAKPQLGNRYIDPITRDYVLDVDTGEVQQDTSAASLVYLALATVRGSASVATLGPDALPDKFTTRVLSDATASIRKAVKHLTDAGLIELTLVEVTRDPQVPTRLHRHVKWRDLLTGKELDLRV